MDGGITVRTGVSLDMAFLGKQALSEARHLSHHCSGLGYFRPIATLEIEPLWNFKGYLNNAWHRCQVSVQEQ